jgi:predicted metal-dependent phosphoesterase TrpH
MFADLHLHTCFSDGTFTPDELAERGSRLGLVAMALTDHDTVEGCQRMSEACRARGIESTPGIELTAEREGNEVHFLGYFVDTQSSMLVEQTRKFQEVRQSRIYEMVALLNQLGFPLQAETVFALANCRAPGRPHVGRALVQEGFCANLDEAFERFLKKDRPAWVPKFKISAFEAINLIHSAGGLAVMAHPGLNRTDDFIPTLAQHGMDGIECYHSKHTPTATARYLQIAAQYGLLVTGGSDCHGYSKGKPLLGTAKVPAVRWQKLKEAWENRQPKPAPAPAANGVQ